MINVDLMKGDAVLSLDPLDLTVRSSELLDGGIVRMRTLGRFDYESAFWLFRGDAELFELGEVEATIRRMNERGYTAALWTPGEFRYEVFTSFLGGK